MGDVANDGMTQVAKMAPDLVLAPSPRAGAHQGIARSRKFIDLYREFMGGKGLYIRLRVLRGFTHPRLPIRFSVKFFV